jgi:hypothetical protein
MVAQAYDNVLFAYTFEKEILESEKVELNEQHFHARLYKVQEDVVLEYNDEDIYS